MAVTECVSTTDAIPANPPKKPAAPVVTAQSIHAKEAGPETPPLTRQRRKVADATLAAAQFIPSLDGKNAMRKCEVHGMAVSEFISAGKAADTGKETE
jgi:hypothetical protein